MRLTRGSVVLLLLLARAATFFVVENDRVEDGMVLESVELAVVSELRTRDRKEERRGVRRRVVVVWCAILSAVFNGSWLFG